MFDSVTDVELIEVMGEATRRERTELIAEEERQRQAWLAATYEPPPF